MATSFVVQCFQLKGSKLVADQPKTTRTGEAAVALAERLGEQKAGVIAFSQEIDIQTDSYDEPRVLYRTGTIPPGLFEE
jgi:ketol-acid reductoisomerase